MQAGVSQFLLLDDGLSLSNLWLLGCFSLRLYNWLDTLKYTSWLLGVNAGLAAPLQGVREKWAGMAPSTGWRWESSDQGGSVEWKGQRKLLSQSLSSVQLFETPWTAAPRAFLSIANSRSLLKLMPTEPVVPGGEEKQAKERRGGMKWAGSHQRRRGRRWEEERVGKTGEKKSNRKINRKWANKD